MANFHRLHNQRNPTDRANVESVDRCDRGVSMNKSETISALAGALAKAQAELKNPAFDSQNPHFRSKYASLAAVRDATIPILAKHGLSVTQLPICDNGQAGCETVLMHSSGEYISNTLMLFVDKPTAHGVGSALTYARRYALMAICGVVGDDDDDGNAAVGKPANVQTPALKEPITPTTGAWDNVPRERHEILYRIASGVIDCFSAGEEQKAHKYLEEQNLFGEEKIAVWTLFDSKQRAALKRIHKAQQDAAKLAEQA